MPEFSDFLAYSKQVQERAEAKKQREVVAVVPRIREITHKAQSVVDHPGWQWYLDMCESHRVELDVKRKALIERLVTGTDLGRDLEILKINLNTIDAEMAGLAFATSLIPNALEAGNRIIAGVAVPPAAAASVAD